jgi:hypothetical protein
VRLNPRLGTTHRTHSTPTGSLIEGTQTLLQWSASHRWHFVNGNTILGTFRGTLRALDNIALGQRREHQSRSILGPQR